MDIFSFTMLMTDETKFVPFQVTKQEKIFSILWLKISGNIKIKNSYSNSLKIVLHYFLTSVFSFKKINKIVKQKRFLFLNYYF